MICSPNSIWLLVWTIIAYFVNPANVQIAMPMFPPQPFAYMAMPAAVVVLPPKESKRTTTTTTTTTTTPRTVAIAFPVPMPMQVPYAVPAMPPPPPCLMKPKSPQCPPCPPCLCTPCTPSFFSYCSPCHQKCRCQDGQRAPVPLPPPPIAMPYPMPAPMAVVPPPPPVMVMPFRQSPVIVPRPSRRRRRPISLSSDSDDTQSSESNALRMKKTYKRHKMRQGRRNFEDTNADMVKPVLSYVARNGEVKFETKISSREAAELLREKTGSTEQFDNGSINDGESPQNVKIFTKEDRKTGRNLVVVSNNDERRRAESSKEVPRKLPFRLGSKNQNLEEGRKELIFNAPPNKKITNMSVSFQIAR